MKRVKRNAFGLLAKQRKAGKIKSKKEKLREKRNKKMFSREILEDQE